MRQGQQNRRGRGRNNPNNNNNNNRKNQNPLTRSFESNGPDVKIRGTPSHIAEKYISLARDALSSGDPVLAENYLQHAEHYNRIIMAFREQQIQQGGDPGAVMVRRPQISGDIVDGDEFDDDGDETGEAAQPGGLQQPFMGVNEPQPTVRGFEPREGTREGSGEHRQERRYDNGRNDQRDGRGRDFHLRNRDRQHGMRGGEGQQPMRQDPRQDQRGDGGRPERFEQRSEGRPEMRGEARQDSRGEHRPEPRHEPRNEPRSEPRNEPRSDQNGRRGDQQRRPRDQFGSGEQPEFLRRPVRRPRREMPEEGGAAAPSAPAEPVAVADDSSE